MKQFNDQVFRAIRLFIVLTFFMLFSVSSRAQVLDTALLKDIRARHIGPGGMSGRVTAIDVNLRNTDEFYIGTASGGLWKTTNGGTNFTPVFDDQKVAGIGALAIDPSNPDVVWAGTGEGNPRNSITGGYGLYRTLDGGRTWELMGLEETRHIHRIIVHPRNSDIIYAGAIGSPWGPHRERGVYRSTDGGETWEQILFVNEHTGVADMVMDPGNPNKMFVAMWEHHRQPWFFESGGPGSGLYLTVDGGDSWKEITSDDGLPEGDLGRMGLAIAAGNTNVVYALVESKKNAIYRSQDGGYTWERRGTENIGDRPFYYAEIYVDPANENRLYSLYSRVNISEDGGKTFRRLVGRNIHSDHHAWWIHPEDPSFMIDGNDGGMAISFDMGKNWRHITNLPVSQFYHIRTDDALPYNVYGGMQDNGSWKGPGYTWRRGGIINEYWEFLLGGDGFDVVPVPGNHDLCYAMSQQGNVRRINLRTGHSVNIKPVHPDAKELRFHWNAAIEQDPFDEHTIYFGSQFVHRSTDRGDSWEIISPDLTTDDSTWQQYDESGGLTYDVTGAENYTTILTIDPSPLEEDVIWAGTDDGQVQLTRDGGDTWNNLTSRIKGMPEGGWIPQIKPSRYHKGEAFVVVNHYRRNDYDPYLFHTDNFGKSWERMINEEDVWGYMLSFVQDPVEPDLMFAGTEFGLYVSINGGEDWMPWKNGYPTVSTMDMVVQEREADLVIGTFGRSAYVIDDLRPLREWARLGSAFTGAGIRIFNAPDAYMVSRRNLPGYYFHGDAEFMGDNRPRGAMITCFTGEEKEEGKDTLFIRIINQEGDTIRTLSELPHKGMNRFYWDFDRRGVRIDLGKTRQKRSSEPGGGGTVLPGKYTLLAQYREDTSAATLTVHPDPRVDYDPAAHRERLALTDTVMHRLVALNEARDTLRTCRKILASVESVLEIRPDDSLQALVDSTGQQLDSLVTPLFERPDVQGIYRSETHIYSRIRGFFGVRSGYHPVTPNERIMVEQAMEEQEAILETIDAFLTDHWEPFRRHMEKQEIRFFR